ncbi:MAG: AMP-binding enzyme, partial [Thermodesulfobacteriota bacterium]
MEASHNENIWLPDGSFNTGDLGKIDEDGYVWLTGRKKELIIRGGHNIDPAIIEEPLYKMAGVKTVAAVGKPDPYSGEVPVAYVQKAEDTDINEKQIMEWAKQNVGEKAAALWKKRNRQAIVFLISGLYKIFLNNILKLTI